jgi:hypothetical protein
MDKGANHMNRYEEAIATLKERIRDIKDFLGKGYISELTQSQKNDQIEDCELAIEALRTAAERESTKPCEYCYGELIYGVLAIGEINRQNAKIAFINGLFCPLCGRKLEPKEARE